MQKNAVIQQYALHDEPNYSILVPIKTCDIALGIQTFFKYCKGPWALFIYVYAETSVLPIIIFTVIIQQYMPTVYTYIGRQNEFWLEY